uniref:Putative secreted protein n=1 Tax=Ixodes ricinus TaxID=34613 RepID=A0A6B0UKI0_IXORI
MRYRQAILVVATTEAAAAGRAARANLRMNCHQAASPVKRAALRERPLRFLHRRDSRRERKSRVRAEGWPGWLPVESAEIGGATFLGSVSRSGVGADPKRRVEHVRLDPDRPVK